MTAPVPVAVAGVAWLLAAQPCRRSCLSCSLFCCRWHCSGPSFVGLGISLWPYGVVPGRITIWDAAAPESSQVFMLVGVGILLPMILGYTAWAYWVFRGKVRAGSGYH